jgi:dihydrofolate reductase
MTDWFQPGQVPVVVTRDASLAVPDGHAVRSVAEGIALAERSGAGELVVMGGGQVFAAAMPYAGKLLLTEVHARIAGDVFFPAVPAGEWREVESHHHPADAAHAFAFTIRLFRRQFS